MSKTSSLIRYCLVQDNDGHEYVVPVTRRAEWNAMSPSKLERGVPKWATRIDGAHVLSFTDWSEGDGDVDMTYAAPTAPKPVSLADLVGSHLLQGVDLPKVDEHKLADWVRFKLDGKVYVATEDPNDGYRSMMESIAATDAEMVNTFRGIRVIARMRQPEQHYTILDIVHAKSDRLILSVGTDNIDDYYPSWVASFDKTALQA